MRALAHWNGRVRKKIPRGAFCRVEFVASVRVCNCWKSPRHPIFLNLRRSCYASGRLASRIPTHLRDAAGLSQVIHTAASRQPWPAAMLLRHVTILRSYGGPSLPSIVGGRLVLQTQSSRRLSGVPDNENITDRLGMLSFLFIALSKHNQKFVSLTNEQFHFAYTSMG